MEVALARIFETTPVSLRYLLDSIHSYEVALPDFQRDFVWDASATRELLKSILKNYPAGSLLRIKNSSSVIFKPREVAGAPALDGRSPSYLVLDGQQRLTSLYQALYGAGKHRYFIDMDKLLQEKDLDDCVFHLQESQAKHQFGTVEKQASKLVFPLEVLFKRASGFETWLDHVLEQRNETMEKSKQLKEDLRKLRETSIKNIEDYEFPMVTLAENEEVEAEAVCTIFETLNNTGVKLSVFDLLAARFWPEEVDLRKFWDNAKEDHPILSDFSVDPYYILQAIAIFTAKAAPSCKRGDVLKMKVEQIRAGWEPAVRGMAEVLQMLRDDCGVFPDWLPYNPILIPAGAVFAKHKDAKGPQVGAIRDKAKRWFWCSVFGQAYENAANSQAVKDFTELTSWFNGGPEPESVRNFLFEEPDELRETTPRQRAVYRGCIALILCSDARDFHSGNRITASMVREKNIDDHHVFPKGYLADSGEDVDPVHRDCVLNRTLIDKETNIRINKKAPADYLREIEAELDAERLDEVLKSHLLPGGRASSLREGRFSDFLDERQQRFAERIEEVTK